MSVSLRPVAIPADAPRLAQLYNTARPNPIGAKEVEEWERQSPTGTVRQRSAAVSETGEVLGINVCERMPFSLAGSYYVDVVVDPAQRGRGIGRRLYEDALLFAQTNGATRLEAEVRDSNPEWLAWAQRRGFRVDRHIFESRLDLADFDETRFAGTVEAVEAGGIRLFSQADAGDTPEHRRALYALDMRTSADIPGHEGTMPTFEDWERFVYESSTYRPDGLIIAAHGEQWIGQSVTVYQPNTNSTYIQHTGVDRAYRGRHIALALKLLGIRWSRRIGAAYTRTQNDSENAPILAINGALGYRPLPGQFRVLKKLQ